MRLAPGDSDLLNEVADQLAFLDFGETPFDPESRPTWRSDAAERLRETAACLVPAGVSHIDALRHSAFVLAAQDEGRCATWWTIAADRLV